MLELSPDRITLQHHAENAAQPWLAIWLKRGLEDCAAIGADRLACGNRADKCAVILLAARAGATGGDQHQQEVRVGAGR